MTLAPDEMGPFDLQVVNLARLQFGTLQFTQSELIVPEFGTFYYPQVDVMQLKDNGVPSRFQRALTIAGGKAMAKLHFELLTQALDFDEMNAENKRIAEERAAMRKAQYSGGLGAQAQQMGLMQQQQLARLQQQVGVQAKITDDKIDALQYGLSQAVANPPLFGPEPAKDTPLTFVDRIRNIL